MPHTQKLFTVENPKNLERLIAAISSCTHSTELTADQLTESGKIPKRNHNKVFNMRHYCFEKVALSYRDYYIPATQAAAKCGTPSCVAGHAKYLLAISENDGWDPFPCSAENHLGQYIGVSAENSEYIAYGSFSEVRLEYITVKETVDYLTALLKHNTQGN